MAMEGGAEVIQLLVVDDQELMRDGLIAILERQPGIQIVGAAADGAEAQRLQLGTVPRRLRFS